MNKMSTILNTRYNYKIIVILFVFMFSLGITSGVYLNKIYYSDATAIKAYITQNTDFIGFDMNTSKLIYVNAKNDFLYLFMLYICSLVVLIYPLIYGVVFIKGLSIGYAVNTLILTLKLGSIKSIMIIFLKNIIILPCSILVVVLSFNYFLEIINAIKFSRKFKNKKYLKKVFKKVTINMASIFAVTIILQSALNGITMIIFHKFF